MRLPGFLVDLLSEHTANTGGRELLFANRRGAPMRHTAFLRRWRPACDGAPTHSAPGEATPTSLPSICPELRFHDLRHAHKRMLIELDVPEILPDERPSPAYARSIGSTCAAAALTESLASAMRLRSRTGSCAFSGSRLCVGMRIETAG
jgi:hypothetical protein